MKKFFLTITRNNDNHPNKNVLLEDFLKGGGDQPFQSRLAVLLSNTESSSSTRFLARDNATKSRLVWRNWNHMRQMHAAHGTEPSAKHGKIWGIVDSWKRDEGPIPRWWTRTISASNNLLAKHATCWGKPATTRMVFVKLFWTDDEQHHKSLSGIWWTEDQLKQDDAHALEYDSFETTPEERSPSKKSGHFLNKRIQDPTKQRSYFLDAKHTHLQLYKDRPVHPASQTEHHRQQFNGFEDTATTQNQTKQPAFFRALGASRQEVE